MSHVVAPLPIDHTEPTAVWDRLWDHQPSACKDDSLIERECRSRRWMMIVQQLVATFGSIRGLRTIELGSGRGDLSTLLAQQGAEVTLLDASHRALDQARARFDRLNLSADYTQGNMLESLNGLTGCFDVALSSGVIEHFSGVERTSVIRAHHDVLKPGGLAVISVPNSWCVPYRLRKWYLELRGWWPYGLELPYAKAELIRRAKEAGFARSEAAYLRFDRSLHRKRDGRDSLECTRGQSTSSPAFGLTQLVDRFTGLVLILFGWRSS